MTGHFFAITRTDYDAASAPLFGIRSRHREAQVVAGCAIANHSNVERIQYAKHLFTDAARFRQLITNDGDQRQILLDLNPAQRGKFGQQPLGEQGIAS